MFSLLLKDLISVFYLRCKNLTLNSVLKQAIPTNGPNQDYTFPGTGAAMTNTYNSGTPCAYGGLVYAYTARGLRLWRPDHSTGAAVCIGSAMGHGVYSQAARTVRVVIKIWEFLYLSKFITAPYQIDESPRVCSKYSNWYYPLCI